MNTLLSQLDIGGGHFSIHTTHHYHLPNNLPELKQVYILGALHIFFIYYKGTDKIELNYKVIAFTSSIRFPCKKTGKATLSGNNP